MEPYFCRVMASLRIYKCVCLYFPCADCGEMVLALVEIVQKLINYSTRSVVY